MLGDISPALHSSSFGIWAASGIVVASTSFAAAASSSSATRKPFVEMTTAEAAEATGDGLRLRVSE